MKSDLPLRIYRATIIDGTGAPARSGELFVKNGRISRDVQPEPFRELDLQGYYISPGWVDLHVHVFAGFGLFSLPPADAGFVTGVTTLIDAGSAGALNYPLFEEAVRNRVRERVAGYVNIATPGILHGHSEERGFIGDHIHSAFHCEDLALGLLSRFGGSIAGWKVRLSSILAGDDEAKERRAFEALLKVRDASGLPVMIHHVKSRIPAGEILDALAPGDVYTHCFHGHGGSPFGEKTGKPCGSALAARDRGVLFDVGHGMGAFSWEVAEKAFRDYSFPPDTISSDLHYYNLFSPVCNLANILSRFLLLGLSLEEVIAAATGNTGLALKGVSIAPSLSVGAPADLTIFRLEEGDFELTDAHGIVRRSHQRIIPLAVLRGGTLIPCYGYHLRGSDSDAFARSCQSIA